MADVLLLAPDLEPALRRAGLTEVDALFDLGGALAQTSVVREVALDVEGTIGRFHLKRYHYPGWRKSRGLLGRGTLGGTAPAVSEYRALARLRESGIPSVRPVAAASRTRGGRLVSHLLLTEHLEGTRDLAQALRDVDDEVVRDPAFRRRTLDALAKATRRMHDAGFVHRDLRPRNVLLRAEQGAPAIYLLDCRRGGDPSWRHGRLDDLASLDLDVESLATRAERFLFLRAYLGADPLEERGRAARSVSQRRERQRRRMHRRGRRVR